jgi:hypothetical protein
VTLLLRFEPAQPWGSTVSAAFTSRTTQTFAPDRRTPPGRHAGGVRQSRVHAPPIGTRRPETPNKRVMDIEDVLRWAFRDELPKRRENDGDLHMREYPSVCPMFAMAQHGGRIENFTREPGFPAAMGEPHPDALIVEAAVLGLSRFSEHRFAGYLGLATGLPQDSDEHGPMAWAMSQLVDLVRIKARLGARPTFAASPLPAAVVDKQGRPVVMIQRAAMKADDEGRLRPHLVEEKVGAEGKDRYPRGAYCILEWDEPKSILMERAEYAAWWAGLDLLAHELAGRLATIAVLPPAAAQRPWTGEEDAAKPKRILDNLSSRKRLREQRVDQVVNYLLSHRRKRSSRKSKVDAATQAADCRG